MDLFYIYFANVQNKLLARFFFQNKYVLKKTNMYIYFVIYLCARSYFFIIQ